MFKSILAVSEGGPDAAMSFKLATRVAGIFDGTVDALHLPVGPAGGMAGGSADAAGALLACDALWELNTPRSLLMELAADLGSDVPFALHGGTAIASGEVARALDTQLASAPTPDAAVSVGVTFRDGAQRYCRTFESGATGGIACANGKAWRIERLYGGMSRQEGAYRQASSPAAAMMADAQAMMAGDPFGPAAERAARDAGWR